VLLLDAERRLEARGALGGPMVAHELQPEVGCLPARDWLWLRARPLAAKLAAAKLQAGQVEPLDARRWLAAARLALQTHLGALLEGERGLLFAGLELASRKHGRPPVKQNLGLVWGSLGAEVLRRVLANFEFGVGASVLGRVCLRLVETVCLSACATRRPPISRQLAAQLPSLPTKSCLACQRKAV